MTPNKLLFAAWAGAYTVLRVRARRAQPRSGVHGIIFVLASIIALNAPLQSVVQAQVSYSQLKSFGFAPMSGSWPLAGLTVGPDGAFYGTTSSQGGSFGIGTVFKLSPDKQTFQILHRFNSSEAGCCEIVETVSIGPDGALYGTTSSGGTSGLGTVFRLSTDGQVYQVLHNFSGTGTDGAHPAPLAIAADGTLFGVTSGGGSFGDGTAFKLSPDGQSYQTIYNFNGFSDGKSPGAGLIVAPDGTLYGTTETGGWSFAGTVFALSPDGKTYKTLHSFNLGGGDGATPLAALTIGTDGSLYGTTFQGGTSGSGTVFKVSPDGQTYQLLHSFNDAGGAGPGALVVGTGGTLYGTTYWGGSFGSGTAFQLSPDGQTYRVLHSFSNTGGDGAGPATLAVGVDGALYSTTQMGGGLRSVGTIFEISQDGQNYQILHYFSDSGGDGANPGAGLVVGSDGDLYGTTTFGGSSDSGTVFKLTPDGQTSQILHSFSASQGDGAAPYSAIALGADGTLYGTTTIGGNSGYGTVFNLTSDGQTYGVLHSFSNGNGDGAYPDATLAIGTDGTLYGTTFSGGIFGYGTAFRLSSDGQTYQILHGFGNSAGDGANPDTALTIGSDGTLYGTTYSGGASGFGTVFKLSPDGQKYQVLHAFTSSYGDGAGPEAALVIGADDFLYGTTYAGGSSGLGVAFKLSLDGQIYQILHTFGNDPQDGGSPFGALVEGSDGVFYGTTSQGGDFGNGTIFGMNLDGQGYRTLHTFGATSGDGGGSYAPLVQGKGGIFYGTAFSGGDLDLGTVFQLIPNTSLLAGNVNWINVENITINSVPGQCSATVNFNVGAMEGPTVFQVACIPPAGSAFPIGTTSVQCTATDPFGNSASTSFSVTVNPSSPVLGSLNPSSVATSSALTLRVNGCGFGSGTTLLWNGAPRPTTLLNSGQLTAAISSSDLTLGSDQNLSTVIITVQNADGSLSGPLPFTIINPSTTLGTVESQAISAGQTGTVMTSASAGQTPAVTASINNSSGMQPIAVSAGVYSSNPVSGTSFATGSTYTDLQVSGATANSSMVATFFSTQSDASLVYFNGSSWAPVLSDSAPPNPATAPAPTPVTGGATFTVVFDAASTPPITQLTGTVIAMARKLDQSITFTAPTTQVLSSQLNLTATASSGQPVAFSITPNSPATLAGKQLTFTGVGTVVVTASQAGNTYYKAAAVSQTILVQYAPPGVSCSGNPCHVILQPINADGSSVFKQGSTVPAKFMVFDANCNSVGTPGVVSNFKLIKTTGGVVSGINETVSSATPDTAFRWDSMAKQWVFNISTKSLLASSTYYYELDLNDGTSILFNFGLK